MSLDPLTLARFWKVARKGKFIHDVNGKFEEIVTELSMSHNDGISLFGSTKLLEIGSYFEFG